jgi:ribosomal protein S18 acetylase RimI-like enzyme
MTYHSADASVDRLPTHRAEEAVVVLADSFAQYPVMRHIIGNANGDYDSHLLKLMRFFTAARYCRDEPVLAVTEGGRAVATAILTPPFQREAPLSLSQHREALWRDLGQDARERYEALGSVWSQFTVPDPHYHLNMIGVLKSHAGRGLGRLLLDAVHDLSLKDENSVGVSLNTEDESNVPLYEHFGYEVLGRARATDSMETWVMFRRDGG